MSVSLEAVQFNHDPGSATTDAFTIRRNATQTVTLPEWRKGISVTPEDSPAAYSIQDTLGHTLTIRANFRRTNPSLTTVEVRAIDPAVDPPGQSGCAGFIAKILRALAKAVSGNPLGEVKARSVTFGASGETGLQTFELLDPRLWNVGVGARTTTWVWQWRTGGGAWTDFATTSHRIYSVLRIPTAPWTQAAGTQLPWTEALDVACQWALLAKDEDQAAERVTQRVYDLGPSVVTYDCPGGGSTNYAWPSFNLTAFLDRLKGGPGLGIYVNCSDCATFVSTMANLVGCDLWQSRMGSGFGLNPMLGIGSAVWQPCCGWSGFSYHEVAWKGACGVNDPVWDACLQVDGDADPTSAPHTPMLPVNLPFGATGAMLYRDRLATVAGRPVCNPQPGTKQRRAVN